MFPTRLALNGPEHLGSVPAPLDDPLATTPLDDGRPDTNPFEPAESLVATLTVDPRAGLAEPEALPPDGTEAYGPESDPETTTSLLLSAGPGVTRRGGSRDDRLTGTNRDDGLIGNGGDDKLKGKGGQDYLQGGDGNDKMNGGGGADIIVGLDGKDRANGGSGNDEIYGGRGKDKLNGGRGADLLDGGGGKDVLVGGRGEDTFRFNTEGPADKIKDFDVGTDLIGFGEAFGVEEDFDVSVRRGDTRITHDDSTVVVLENVRLREAEFAQLWDDGLVFLA